ncbi:hypothetical protein L345_11328, partial [Ophiophagus hannah]
MWRCNVRDPIPALENSRTAVPLILRLAILKVNAGVCLLEARMLENARKQLQEKFLKVQSQLLEENQKCEQQEAMVKHLQKHVKLLTNESRAKQRPGSLFLCK